jgi:peptide methionine sulfoxide reductase msrA/msrB
MKHPIKSTQKLFLWLGLSLMFSLVNASDQPAAEDTSAVATFAGGCFWCTESDFEKLEGVNEVISGYTGGSLKNPTYSQVSSGRTQHIESVEVHYDPDVINYDQLLDAFWKMVNPTDDGGQFVDRGYQYTTAIFVHNPQQQKIAEASLKALSQSGRYDKPLVTPIRQAGTFYPAEDYHQNYYKKNPLRYRLYRWNSGRDQYLKKIWGDEILHK